MNVAGTRSRLEAILQAIASSENAIVEAFVAGKGSGRSRTDAAFRHLLTVNATLIAEAVRELPEKLIAAHPEVPWAKLAQRPRERPGVPVPAGEEEYWVLTTRELAPLRLAIQSMLMDLDRVERL
jgi:uncharacterized protein with HEPN domain